jgi:hypothetical protein
MNLNPKLIPFFRNHLTAKTHRLWYDNVRYRMYCAVRRRLIKKMFLAKKAFLPILLEINRQTYDLSKVSSLN